MRYVAFYDEIRRLNWMLLGLSAAALLGLTGCEGEKAQARLIDKSILTPECAYAQAAFPPADAIVKNWRVADQFVAARTSYGKFVTHDIGSGAMPELRENIKPLLRKHGKYRIYASIVYQDKTLTPKSKQGISVKYYYQRYPAIALVEKDELPERISNDWVRGEDGIAQGSGIEAIDGGRRKAVAVVVRRRRRGGEPRKDAAVSASAATKDKSTSRKVVAANFAPATVPAIGNAEAESEAIVPAEKKSTVGTPLARSDKKKTLTKNSPSVVSAATEGGGGDSAGSGISSPVAVVSSSEPEGESPKVLPQSEDSASEIASEMMLVGPELSKEKVSAVVIAEPEKVTAPLPAQVYLAANGVVVEVKRVGKIKEDDFAAAVTGVRRWLASSLEAERKFRAATLKENSAKRAAKVDISEKMHPATKRLWHALYIFPGGEIYDKKF